jgi:hypothetical protein
MMEKGVKVAGDRRHCKMYLTGLHAAGGQAVAGEVGGYGYALRLMEHRIRKAPR